MISMLYYFLHNINLPAITDFLKRDFEIIHLKCLTIILNIYNFPGLLLVDLDFYKMIHIKSWIACPDGKFTFSQL